MLKAIYYTPAATRRYSAPFCSFATLLYLLLVVCLLVVPFILAFFSSGSFWLKESAFWEQPQVIYTDELLLLVEGTLTTSLQPFSLRYSSNPLYNQLLEPSVRQPVVKSWMVDKNADGKTDVMHFQIQVPVADNEDVKHVRLALGVQYQLSSRIRFLTRDLLLLDLSSALSGSSVYLDGEMVLAQQDLMQDHVSYAFSTPALNFTQALSGEDALALTWPRIVSDQLDRNARLQVAYTMPIWSTPRGYGKPFSITLNVRVPTGKIVYRPGLLEVLKNGWIQYAACFGLVALVVLPVYDYLLRHQVVSSHVSLRPSNTHDHKSPGQVAGFKSPLF